MFNHGKHGIHGKGLRAAVRALRGLGESLPLCGAGRAFAIGFCENARLLLSKGWKNLRQKFQGLENPQLQTPNSKLQTLSNFNPTNPTITRLKDEIMEGLSA